DRSVEYRRGSGEGTQHHGCGVRETGQERPYYRSDPWARGGGRRRRRCRSPGRWGRSASDRQRGCGRVSDSKKPGSGKIIRTSSGSTRLTAGSSKNESKPAESTGQGQKSGSQGSGQAEQKATVVAPPAPKASPKPSRAPSAGSQG